jgi:hypothetical protein
MGFDYTSDALIKDIKRRTFMPISQITYDDSDILDFADEETQVGIVPLLMSVREDYLVTYKEDAIQADTVAYNMHKRAIVQKLKDVTVIESNSNPANPIEISIPRIQSDQAPSGLLNNYPGFYVRNNKVILQNPEAFTGQKLRQYYFLRPSKLVTTINACKITRVGPDSSLSPVLQANQIEVSLIPTEFGTTATFNQTVDIVKGNPGFEILSMDVEATFNINTLIITFSSLTELPEELEVNDWVCLAGETVVPQIPVEMHPILAQRAAIKVLEGMGDSTNLQLAQGKLKEMEKAILGLLSNRIEGEPQKVINPYSPLRVYPWRRF